MFDFLRGNKRLLFLCMGVGLILILNLFIPETRVLHIETPQGRIQSALKNRGEGELSWTVLNTFSNSREIVRCCHNNEVHFSSSDDWNTFQTFPMSEKISEQPFLALKTERISDTLVELLALQKPVIAIVQDNRWDEYLVTIGEEAEMKVVSLQSLLPQSLEGKVEIGPSFYLRLWPTAVQIADAEKKEDNRPSIQLCFSEGELSEIVCLTYDPTGSGRQWPLFNGKYQVSYRPLE